MASEVVNILINVQNAASEQIKNVSKSLDGLAKKQQSTNENLKKDEAAKQRYYTQLLKEQQRVQDRISKELEKEQENRIKNAKKLLTDFQKFSMSLLKGLTAGSLLGGWLGFRGYEFAKESAQAEQVRLSFQRTFGTASGSILFNVRNSVKGITDDMTLMRQAIKTNIEGVSPDRLAQIFKLGAVASQRLGKSAEEGIELARRAIVEFDEGALTELGILNKRDASYKTYLAILEKTTKGLGQYAKIQFQTNYVVDQMKKRFGDNFDVMQSNLQGFQLLESAALNLKRTIGGLVNEALGPMARRLGNWLAGIYEMLSSFDPRTGKARISLDLSKMLGPENVETIRRISAGILDFIDATKGFLRGIAATLKPVIEFLGKMAELVGQTGSQWERIGKLVGIVVTSVSLLAIALAPVLATVTAIVTGFLTMKSAAGILSFVLGGMRGNLLRSILGSVAGVGGIGAGGAGAAGAGGINLLESGLGGAAATRAIPALLSNPLALGALGVGAAGAATLHNTRSAISRMNIASGMPEDAGLPGISDFAPWKMPSFAPLGASDSDQARKSRNDENMVSLMGQQVNILSSINNKLDRRDGYGGQIQDGRN